MKESMVIRLIRLILIILFVVISACNNSKKDTPDKFVLDIDENHYELDIPNPIIVNQNYTATIIYHSSLDELNLELGKERYVIFYTSKEIDSTFSNLEKVKLNPIPSIDNNKIYLELKFNSVGDNRLRGYIEETAFIEKTKDSSRMITNRIFINAVIPVKEKGNDLAKV